MSATDGERLEIHWLPLTREPEYLARVEAAMGEWGVDAVHLSHRLCHVADSLIDDPERAETIRGWTHRFRDAGAKVWLWTHEVHAPPPEFVREGRLDTDEPGLYEHLAQKYRHVFDAVAPEVDGVVLTFAETQFPVYQASRIRSAQSPPARVAALVSVMRNACIAQGRRLAVRDFVYRRDEVEAMREAIDGTYADVAVMSKCVPHDWHPYYPANPLVGAWPGREQWIEHDLGHEYEGQHLYPFADLRTLWTRLEHGRGHGARAVCLRLDRYHGDCGQSALDTPWGRLELTAAHRFAREPGVELDQVWKDWEATQFPGARRLTEVATAAAMKFLFPMRMWLADHSRLPSYAYAVSHLNDGNADRLHTWTGADRDRETDDLFRRMPPSWLAQLLAEGDEARALAQRCVETVNDTDDLGPDAAAWTLGVERLAIWADLFHAYREAFFRLRFADLQPGVSRVREIELAVDRLEQTIRAHRPRLAQQQTESGPSALTRGPPHELIDDFRRRIGALV